MSTERGRRRMARAAEHAGGRACRGRPPDACAFFFSSRRRHTRWNCDWSSDVCSSDLILDVDHPDIEDFIWCKAIEERKARVLRDAGFDMDLDGKDSHSIQYQNANNSVRVTDEFMQAVVDGTDWELKAVKTGEVTKTLPA